ncbi:DUF937 domain-containing protein [Streptomyces mirabilis]|uniref:DUF937 domain-containing protein n=1 Tax=Streptomyces mirabilis TaxID=68239 RepID=UPI002251445C|nr:DUF937 domain-containing protein [Streptomyces mirabilis]MCX4434025.1 DUF937 domain-containing protein [Streptomyces mirabilis]
MSESASSFEDDVLGELGDDRLQEIAGLLGTDTAGAQEVVGTTVSALAGPVQEEAATAPKEEAPLQGVSTLGGFATGGLMAGVLAKVSKPVANAVAKKTGIPAATVTRVIEMLVPVVLTVLSKRAARKK